MNDTCRIFWGETHDNTYQVREPLVSMDESVRRAAAHLDFYAAAYYTACSDAFNPGGHLAESDRPHKLVLEGWKDQAKLDREWPEVNEICRDANAPGEFVTFPGYEWQGDGSGGDHNVFALTEGLPVFRVDTLPELYASLRGREAIAIPHHTAYHPGIRGRNWDVFDPVLSPFCEIYSIHGCSETDEEWVKLRNNSHMGPGSHAGTWQAALDRGLRIGAVCSNDNWGTMPGCFGRGVAAVLAPELTRKALWEAFKARRVYGVTGDRIELDFTVNEAPMGSVIENGGPRVIRVRAVGLDAIDRIELLRNGRVIATHCHQGAWCAPKPGQRSRFKVRIEAGWGPRPNELKLPDRAWRGVLHVAGGKMLGTAPCWISAGQSRPTPRGDAYTFEMLTSTDTLKDPWQNANVFEFEAVPEAAMSVDLNGLKEQGAVAEFGAGAREMWFKDECVRMLQERAGIEPYAPERMDIYHHVAYKARIHRPIPEAGYTAAIDFVDEDPLVRETHYRVRVEQRNAQRAWSSPIWVLP